LSSNSNTGTFFEWLWLLKHHIQNWHLGNQCTEMFHMDSSLYFGSVWVRLIN